MTATFVEIDETELARIQRDPSLAEPLFEPQGAMPDVFLKLSEKMQERVRSVDPRILEHLQARLPEGSDLTGERLFKLMEERRARFLAARQAPSAARRTLSLDKAWHGVHYLLCGAAEPGDTLLSQAVLGGTPLGDDDEGFSGYGPARYFTPAQVVEIARELERPDLEAQCVARFDAEQMSALEIYPGWRTGDKDALLDAIRRFREFYGRAAGDRHAVVTCIV